MRYGVTFSRAIRRIASSMLPAASQLISAHDLALTSCVFERASFHASMESARTKRTAELFVHIHDCAGSYFMLCLQQIVSDDPFRSVFFYRSYLTTFLPPAFLQAKSVDILEKIY